MSGGDLELMLFLRLRSSSKGEDERSSRPTTPISGPASDGFDLKRSASGRSDAALAQTSVVTVEAERALSSSPSASISLGEATQAKASEDAKSSIAIAADPKAREDLPTPPDTPGHSTDTHEAVEECAVEAEVPDVRKVAFHEVADLDIKVRDPNGDDVIYSVRSSALETASQIWRKSDVSQAAHTTDFTSDSALGLNVILSIAHYKFQDVPQKLDLDDLSDVAAVAEKYEVKHLLVPFAKAWVAAANLPDTLSTKAAEKILVTAWLLGQAQWFAKAISQCAYHARISAEGKLVDSDGKPWDSQLPAVSDQVVELISAVRLDAIERIIKAVSAPVHKLLDPQSYPDENIRYCYAQAADESVREECEQLQLGSAIMGLTKAKLWPPPMASRIKTSPSELALEYAGIKMRRYQTPGSRFKEDDTAEDVHAQCGFGHQDEIGKILGLSTPAQLTSQLVEQLHARAKLSGAYSPDNTFQELESDHEAIILAAPNLDDSSVANKKSEGLQEIAGENQTDGHEGLV